MPTGWRRHRIGPISGSGPGRIVRPRRPYTNFPDTTGIEKPEPGQLLFDVVKPDRSDMDIVFEMMLKWGLELTLPVEKSEAAGYPILLRDLPILVW